MEFLLEKNQLIFTNNDSAYDTAIEFKKNGIDPLVVDVRKILKVQLLKKQKI